MSSVPLIVRPELPDELGGLTVTEVMTGTAGGVVSTLNVNAGMACGFGLVSLPVRVCEPSASTVGSAMQTWPNMSVVWKVPIGTPSMARL
jgi:hypothetical protein